MANITLRKENENRAGLLPSLWEPRWEPGRLMRELFGRESLREMAPLARPLSVGFMPAFEIKETKDAYVFKADLPGVRERDLDVTINGHRLTICGKREAETQDQRDTYYTYERSYGEFTRSFTLPDGVDSKRVTADLSGGVLTVALAKLPAVQPKKIAIQSASGQNQKRS